MTLDRGDDGLGVDGFDEKIATARDGAALLIDIPGDDHHRHVDQTSLSPHSFEECPSVETGHVEIEEDDAGAKAFADLPVRVVDAGRGRDGESLEAEHQGHRFTDVVLVVDDKDLMRRLGAGSRHPEASGYTVISAPSISGFR
jgi:hypothetical protein